MMKLQNYDKRLKNFLVVLCFSFFFFFLFSFNVSAFREDFNALNYSAGLKSFVFNDCNSRYNYQSSYLAAACVVQLSSGSTTAALDKGSGYIISYISSDSNLISTSIGRFYSSKSFTPFYVGNSTINMSWYDYSGGYGKEVYLRFYRNNTLIASSYNLIFNMTQFPTFTYLNIPYTNLTLFDNDTLVDEVAIESTATSAFWESNVNRVSVDFVEFFNGTPLIPPVPVVPNVSFNFELNLTPYNQQCYNESGFAKFNVSFKAVSSSQLYYALDCDYQPVNYTIVDDFGDSNYNVQANWITLCNFTTDIYDNIIGRVLFLNDTTCVGDLRRTLLPNSIMSDVVVEWIAYTNADRFLNFQLRATNNYPLLDISLGSPDYNASNYGVYMWNGTDNLVKAYEPTSYKIFFFKTKLNFANHTYDLYANRNVFNLDYEYLGSFPFINNYDNVSIFYVNPYTPPSIESLPSWIDTLRVTFEPNKPTYQSSKFFNCIYDEDNKGGSQIRGYVTDNATGLNYYGSYKDVWAYHLSTCDEYFPPQSEDMNSAFNGGSLTGLPLMVAQLVFVLQFPARMAKTLGFGELLPIVAFVCLFVFFFYEFIVTRDIKESIYATFASACVLGILGLIYPEIFLMFSFLFSIFLAGEFGESFYSETSYTKWFIRFYGIFIAITLIANIGGITNNGFAIIQIPSELTFNTIWAFAVSLFQFIVNVLFFTYIPVTPNYITQAIAILIDIVLWGSRIIVIIENIKYIKELIPFIN